MAYHPPPASASRTIRTQISTFFFLLFFFAFSMRSTLPFHNSGSRKKRRRADTLSQSIIHDPHEELTANL